MLDYSGCWMNNPTDMIALQNQIYVYRDKWWDFTDPIPDYSGGPTPDALRPYQGNRLILSLECTWHDMNDSFEKNLQKLVIKRHNSFGNKDFRLPNDITFFCDAHC